MADEKCVNDNTKLPARTPSIFGESSSSAPGRNTKMLEETEV